MKNEHLLQQFRVIYTAKKIGVKNYSRQRPLKLQALNRLDLMNVLKRALLSKSMELGVILEYGDEDRVEAAKADNLAEKRNNLMRKLNNVIGEDAMQRIYDLMEKDEMEELGKLFQMGRIRLHDREGVMQGFTASEDNDVLHGSWTPNGFVKKHF